MEELGSSNPEELGRTNPVLDRIEQLDAIIKDNCRRWDESMTRWQEARRAAVHRAMVDGIDPSPLTVSLDQALGRVLAVRALLEPEGEGSVAGIVANAS